MAMPGRQYQARGPFPRRQAKARTYVPLSATRTTTTASLAAGAQATVSDEGLINPSTSQAYGRGVLSGLRYNLSVDTAVAAEVPPEYFLLVLPVSMAVPSLLTLATIKANERFIWLRGQLTPNPSDPTIFFTEAAPKTKRRYEMNDRLVTVVVNRGSAVFGAAAMEGKVADVFVTED